MVLYTLCQGSDFTHYTMVLDYLLKGEFYKHFDLLLVEMYDLRLYVYVVSYVISFTVIENTAAVSIVNLFILTIMYRKCKQLKLTK